MKTETFTKLDGYLNRPSELREAIAEYIRSLGITPTEQYVIVFEYLLKNRTHPTVDEIYHSISRSVSDISRSRIYSILDILGRIGAINVVGFDKYTIHYDSNTAPHAHFLCEKCGDVSDLKMCENVSHMMEQYPDVSFRKVQLLFSGLCAKCLAEEGIN